MALVYFIESCGLNLLYNYAVDASNSSPAIILKAFREELFVLLKAIGILHDLGKNIENTLSQILGW